MNQVQESGTSPIAEILIVDDTPTNLRFLSAMLTESGYEVRKATSGRMALKSIDSQLPDLILLDIMMPQMNGYEVCHLLKASEATQDIPVIFLSALNEINDKVKAFKVGGVDYITKPFHVEEVLVRVENQLTIRRLQKKLQQQNEQLQAEIQERKHIEANLKIAYQKLQRLAHLDGLTHVANRRLFDQYLSQQWQQLMITQAPLSLILCDVDYFKLYNDTYGHQEGDECLKAVAQSIVQAVKMTLGEFAHSCLVARYGGEEFTVILPEISCDFAQKVAEAIRLEVLELQRVHQGSNISPYITLSLGIACLVPSENTQIETLILKADQALYQAKRQGRNRAVVLHFQELS